MTSSKATLEEIAHRCGVSSRTAYRVLNGEGGLGKRQDAAERAERIRSIAHELGYRPNQAARAMRDGHFATVGLVLSRGETTSTLAQGLLAGIHDQLATAGLNLAVARLSDEQLSDESVLPGVLRERMLDGLLMFYTHREPPELDALIERCRIPTIWINNARKSDCVYPDDRAGARQATEHLIGLGHRRIAWWNFSSDGHFSIVARREGYLDAMRAAKLKPSLQERPLQTHRVDRTGDDHVAQGREWLAGKQRPTAVVGQSQSVGLVASIAALSLGLRVPEDLSTIFIDQTLDDIAGMGLSRCWAASVEMGRTAVLELLAKVAAPNRTRKPVTIPFRLFEGRSCAPPAGGRRR